MNSPNYMEKSLHVINSHLQSRSCSLRCKTTLVKGRILEATKTFNPGAVVMMEDALCSVAIDSDNWLYRKVVDWTKEEEFDYEAIWYWCALCTRLTKEDKEYIVSSIKNLSEDSPNYGFFCQVVQSLQALPLPLFTAKQAEKLAMFYTPAGTKPYHAATFMAEQMSLMLHLPDRPAELSSRTETALWDRIKNVFSERGLETTLQAWVHNCFETADNPTTYSVFFLPTFSSHSCQPNTVWTLDDTNKFVLMARSSIREGEEITLSYIGDSDLYMPTWKRKAELSDTKHFECICERCSNTSDLSRGFRCPSCGIGTCFLKADREPAPAPASEYKELDDGAVDFREIKLRLDELGANRNLAGIADRKLALGKPLASEWWRLTADELDQCLRSDVLADALCSVPAEVCLICSYIPTEEEIEEVLQFEAWVSVALECGVSSCKTAENWYRRILTRLTQHYYVISFINEYVVAIKEKTPAVAQRLLMRKASIQRRICGFPTAQLAYTFMDLMEVGWASIAGSQESTTLAAGTLTTLVTSEKVFPIALNALFIFGTIFPYNSEYYTDCYTAIRAKLNLLERQEKFSSVKEEFSEVENQLRNVRRQLDAVCRRPKGAVS